MLNKIEEHMKYTNKLQHELSMIGIDLHVLCEGDCAVSTRYGDEFEYDLECTKFELESITHGDRTNEIIEKVSSKRYAQIRKLSFAVVQIEDLEKDSFKFYVVKESRYK